MEFWVDPRTVEQYSQHQVVVTLRSLRLVMNLNLKATKLVESCHRMQLQFQIHLINSLASVRRLAFTKISVPIHASSRTTIYVPSAGKIAGKVQLLIPDESRSLLS